MLLSPTSRRMTANRAQWSLKTVQITVPGRVQKVKYRCKPDTDIPLETELCVVIPARS